LPRRSTTVRTLRTRRDTRSLGASIARVLAPGDLVILTGDLGAGKTFLVGAIARALGSTERVTSPTFSLVHEYRIVRRARSGRSGRAATMLVHADLYRLRDAARTPNDEASLDRLEREVARLGLHERRAEDAIVIVEWGEEAIELLGGSPALVISLSITGPTERAATLSGRHANVMV
jgi:tRNA threonylcarbamoyladenosine biosynthesis protein TsaE